MFFFFLLRVFFCSVPFFFSVFLFYVFFSGKRCNSRKTSPGMFFFVLHSLWEFLRNTETFLKIVNIRRFCTGKREVVCKKHYNLCFQENLCLSQESYTAHALGRVVFFAPRALPAPSLTHSLACPWLPGGNSNLKQNLSFIKVL